MKDRLLYCIEEANVYSRALNEPCIYKFNFKIENHSLSDIDLHKYLSSIRYDQIFVEVNMYGHSKNLKTELIHDSSTSRIMSAERFFEEHSRLFSEIKKRRSLMAKSEAMIERLRDKKTVHLEDMDSDNNYREKRKHSYQANHSIVENQLSSKNILPNEDAFNKAQAHQLLRKVLLDIIKRRKIIEDQIKIIKDKGWTFTV